jgi:hypothetical protein
MEASKYIARTPLKAGQDNCLLLHDKAAGNQILAHLHVTSVTEGKTCTERDA